MGLPKTLASSPGQRQIYRAYLKSIFPSSVGTITVVTARVYLMPIEIPFRCTVNRICVFYTTPVAGNIRAGIYNDNGNTPAGGTLIVESASIAKSGTNRMQEVTIASTQLAAGLYWIAVQSDEATTITIGDNYRFSIAGTIQTYYYDLGGYGAFTTPCPAVTQSAAPANWLRVASIP